MAFKASNAGGYSEESQGSTAANAGFKLANRALPHTTKLRDYLADGDTCWYMARHRGKPEQFEFGLGTYDADGADGVNPELERTSVFSSSNAGSAVTFSAGIVDVILVSLPRVGADYTITNFVESYTLDANAAVAAVADVLATLIRDLQRVGMAGGSTSA